MGRFLKQLIVFSLLAIVFVEGICAFLIVSDLFLIKYPGREIYSAISKSQQKRKFRKVLIGDSVGQQLFPNESEYEDINSLACNQAIGMVGQFILVDNYLKAGNKIDTLIGFFNPTSFSDNLDQVFTFHYFLKPFDTKLYAPIFSAAVNRQIEAIPYHQFSKVPHIYATAWAPEVGHAHRNWTFISPISLDYLQRIKQLSIDNDFVFILYPVPISSVSEGKIRKMNRNETKSSTVQSEFNTYFEKMEYFPDSLFSDSTHLINPALYTAYYTRKFAE